MLVRVISSVILLPLFIAAILINGIILKLTLTVVSAIGMYEFYRAFSENIKPVHCIGFLFAFVYIFFVEYLFSHVLIMIYAFTFFLLVLLLLLVFLHPKVNIVDCMVTLFGFFYVCVLISNIFIARNYFDGAWIVWLILICAWSTDTGAYFAGVKFGKHKLTPVLSPNKTVEGAVGGVLFTCLLAFIYGVIAFKGFDKDVVFCVATGAVGAVFAQFGDLAASAIKRYTGIKDFGSVMPGHGGVLDRFDSVLFTAPVINFLAYFYFLS